MINFQNIVNVKNIFEKINKLFQILLSFDKFLIYCLINNLPAGTEHLKFFLNIKKLNTVVDIGSHKGQFALIAKYFYKKTKVYSFDPLKSSKIKYTSLLKKKDGYHFFHNAIGPKNKHAIINISKSTDASSLLNFSNKLVRTYKNVEKVGEERIIIRKLNNCIKKKNIKKPSLLKLDVQGYEIEALKGCNDLLKYFDYIYLECSYIKLYSKQPLYEDISKWLKKKNYVFVKKFNVSCDYKNKITQADCFFKRSDVAL